jgi:hypothetical protein
LIVIVVIVLFVVVPAILGALLYSMVVGFVPRPPEAPTGVWGMKMPVSDTEYRIDFGKVTTEPKPIDLEIILELNGTTEGVYSFSTNDDGALTLSAGMNVCTMTYHDLADNQKINVGDQLRLTGLSPRSDYTIKMMWAPTGDQITSANFSTP